MQDEGDPLARGEPVQDDPQRHAYGVSEGHLVGRVADVLRDLDRFPLVGHRHLGTEPVQAQARGHRGQPAGEVRDLLLGALQAQPRLLHDVLSLDVVVEHPSRETHQARPFGLEGGDLIHGGHIVLSCCVARVDG